jgi:ABC-2 type transport system permease protein
MLSGFMTTFYGMPTWSQILGSVLPLTYFLRLARGIMLKGYALSEMAPDFLSLLFLTIFLSLLCCILFHRAVKKI